MSDQGIIDPLAGIGDVPEGAARDRAATLVLGNALTVEAANAALASKGHAPLTINSREYAEGAKAGLLNDSEFIAAYSKGSPEAIAALYQADLRIQQSNGKLTDKAPSPGDYNLQMPHQVPAGAPAGMSETYSTEFANLASSIGLPQANANALVEDHFAAVAKTNAMSPEELSSWAEQQTAVLHAALGEGAEAQIAAASKVLSQKSGRSLDLGRIARSNGAGVAINLLFQAQTLIRRN